MILLENTFTETQGCLGKPSRYSIDQLLLSKIQFCKWYPIEDTSDQGVADTVSNTFYSNHTYIQQKTIL